MAVSGEMAAFQKDMIKPRPKQYPKKPKGRVESQWLHGLVTFPGRCCPGSNCIQVGGVAQFEQDQQGDNDIECLASQCDNPCVLGAGTSHLIHTKHHPEPLQVRCVLPSLSMEKSEVEMASVHAGVSPRPELFVMRLLTLQAGSPCAQALVCTAPWCQMQNQTSLWCISLWSWLPWQPVLQPSEQLRVLGK